MDLSLGVAAGLPPQWTRALADLIPTPAEHRERVVGAADALGILGCDQARLDRLVEAGLPLAGVDASAQPLFDFYDLINVGLYSGSGSSLGEMGERVLMRFAGEPADRWTGRKRWEVSLLAECRAGTAHEGGWRLAAPAPEVSGGSCVAWGGGPTADGEPPGALVRREGILELNGQQLTVRAEAVRGLFRQWLQDVLLTGRLRFQWLPPGVRNAPRLAQALGVTDCVSASLQLRQELERLGFEARTRKGHVLGLISVEHAWTEVRDDDGRWKFIDPILAVVAHRTGRAAADFEPFCLGSMANRIVPWDCEASQPLAAHDCAGAPAVVSSVVGSALA